MLFLHIYFTNLENVTDLELLSVWFRIKKRLSGLFQSGEIASTQMTDVIKVWRTWTENAQAQNILNFKKILFFKNMFYIFYIFDHLNLFIKM